MENIDNIITPETPNQPIETPITPKTTPVSSKSNFLKYLFIFSIIVLLISVIYSLFAIKNQKPKLESIKQDNNITETIPTTTPSEEVVDNIIPTLTPTPTPINTSIQPILIALNKDSADRLPDWKNQADKIINDINSVLVKNNIKKQFKVDEYLVYDDKNYQQLINADKFPEYYKEVDGKPRLVYIILNYNSGWTQEQINKNYGDNIISRAPYVYKDGKRYSVLYQTTPDNYSIFSDEIRSRQELSITMHELGHLWGLSVPDWYFYEYSDCTNTEPKFADYSLREDPKFIKDPMSAAEIKKDEIKFTDLNLAILDRNSDLKLSNTEISSSWFSKIVKIRTVDINGTPIPNAIVKVYCAVKGCWNCKTKCDGAKYDHRVPNTSVPEQTLITDGSGYVEIKGPDNWWELNESDNSPCLAKAVKVYSGNKSGVKVINYIDLQSNYVLNNNSNEYILNIPLL
jgi:hypothetical protein